MFYKKNINKKRNDDAEKPFWISYSDLMAACMTLFLVVMAVTIVSLQKEYGTKEALKRKESIDTCFKELKLEAQNSFPAAIIDHNSSDAIRINLGTIVNFISGQDSISEEGVNFLRGYIPSILKSIKSSSCKAYFRRVVVEGYTDTDGDYLLNLDLSLRRSKRVVCSLSPKIKSEVKIDKVTQNQIRDLFLVGGFSFNSFKPDKADNRVVVLKLEFWQLNEQKIFNKENPKIIDLSDKEFGQC
jgi:outer membrane protein OmpA-like peptidoglycan-associated protein